MQGHSPRPLQSQHEESKVPQPNFQPQQRESQPHSATPGGPEKPKIDLLDFDKLGLDTNPQPKPLSLGSDRNPQLTGTPNPDLNLSATSNDESIQKSLQQVRDQQIIIKKIEDQERAIQQALQKQSDLL
jgi:hypothetical protein